MSFDLKLVSTHSSPTVDRKLYAYDPYQDDVTSVIEDICSFLQKAGVLFVVRILSDEPWPLTVKRDLPPLIQTLSRVLSQLARQQNTELVFYAQGAGCTVLLRPGSADRLALTAHNFPVHPCGHVVSGAESQRVALSELVELAVTFLDLTRRQCIDLRDHPWFIRWARDLESHVAQARRYTIAPRE